MRPTETPKTYRVKSFGCQMNVYDGERMAELLAEKGITEAPEGEDADLVVLNTCHIREKAAEKIYSDIGRLTKGKTQKKAPMIAVAGCVAQAEGEEIMKRAPAVSMVVGPLAGTLLYRISPGTPYVLVLILLMLLAVAVWRYQSAEVSQRGTGVTS